MSFLGKVINKLRYWLLALLLVPFLLWFANADKDLMQQIMEPAIYGGATIDLWSTVDRVWSNVIEGHIDAKLSFQEWSLKKWPSLIVRITRVLLALVIALSVTMILYNWLSYIIQTWQWKEGKDLISNVVYIVIWIIVSLLSVTIITILQSVSTTLQEETQSDRKQEIDERLVEGQEQWVRFTWGGIFGNRTQWF